MKVNVISKITEGGEVFVNKKGFEEIDVDLNEVGSISFDSELRLLGLGKNEIYRLSLKSWKDLKKELSKKGLLNVGGRLNLSRSSI